MTAPIVIAQTADEHTDQAKRAWVERTAREACDLGVTFARVTAHKTIPDLILYEGWTTRP